MLKKNFLKSNFGLVIFMYIFFLVIDLIDEMLLLDWIEDYLIMFSYFLDIYFKGKKLYNLVILFGICMVSIFKCVDGI